MSVQPLPFLSGNDAVRANKHYVTNQQMRTSKYVLSYIAIHILLFIYYCHFELVISDLRYGTHPYLTSRVYVSRTQLRSNINTPNFVFSDNII